MNEFIEIEILTEGNIIYEAGKYIEQLINRSYNPKYQNENDIMRNIKYYNNKFRDKTEIEIYNCSQIKKIYNYIQPEYGFEYGFEHAIYQIEFVDKTHRYISQDQYKKLREVLLNTKK